MDDILAQTDTACVRAYRDAKLGRHEEHAEHFAYASEATGVNLAHVDGLGLKKLLEDHAVVGVLASCDADAVRLERLADRGVAEDVIGRGGLLDEPAVPSPRQ